MKDQKKEYDHNRYLENKEKIKEQSKKYYQEHKEQRNKQKRGYNKTHKEQLKKSSLIWRINNKNKAVINTAKRRARKKELPNTLTDEQWGEIKKYFNNVCAYCGNSKYLHQEHFKALSKGGEYTHNNIVPSCGMCNSSKKDNDFFEWYPKQPFYSKAREKKILRFLNYNKKTQQLRLFL